MIRGSRAVEMGRGGGWGCLPRGTMPPPAAAPDGAGGVIGAMNLTSIWTWWPGSCFSYRFHRRSFGLYRCEDGSRFIPSRLRIRQTPESLMVTSWYRFRYIAILVGPKW